MKRGKILFLYGLTSCGKTSAAERMRQMCENALYVSSNDIFHDMIAGKFFARNFWRAVAETIGAQYYAVRAMAEAGFDVAVDGMLLDLPEYPALFGMRNAEMVKTLFGEFDPLFVRFDCPLDELRRRNLVRGDRGEFQSEEQSRLMDPDPPADLTIDALTTFPDEAAARILEAAGMAYVLTETDSDRAELLGQIFCPLTPRILPVCGEGLTREPHRIATEVRTADKAESDAVVRELTRRGYEEKKIKDMGFRLLVRRFGGEITETCRIAADGNFDDLTDRIGQNVTVRIDRPAGSLHPEHPDLVYPIPYGSVPGTHSADGEEIDAYLVGFPEDCGRIAGEEITGTTAGIVYRADDREEKLIVAPRGVSLTAEEITEAVRFTEQFFLSSLILPEGKRKHS